MTTSFLTKNKVIDRLLSDGQLERQSQRTLHKFLNDIELAIAKENREIIHQIIPELDQSSFKLFVQRVARARARYVKFGLEIAMKEIHSPVDIARLKAAREENEELLHAFDAAHRLIERGYVNMA